MLDPRGNDSRGGQTLVATKFRGPLFTDAKHSQVKTVKQMLMMRRKNQQNSFQDDYRSEPKHKSPKYETFPADVNHHQLSPPAFVNLNSTALFPPEANALMKQEFLVTRQQMEYASGHPGMREQMSPASEGKMTLFQWQIQQEARKVEGLSPELLNMQDADGDTFLHIAVAKGLRALAYVLSAKMAGFGSLDIKEHNGQTPLQIAAATNQHLIVHDLLVHGAQVNMRDSWGRSPLHVCAEKGHFLSLQGIWRTLTGSSQLIDVEMFSYDGLTPLHMAVLSHNAVIKEMRNLENPCSYMTMELGQRKHVYVECIKILLCMGASCGTKDLKSGRTSLHMACEEANVELLRIFLDQPTMLSIVNVKTFSGNTALHIVSSLLNHKTQAEAVKLLMRKGADPGVRNLENELPSQLTPDGPVGDKVRQFLKGKHFHA
ncbi:NF-kappa-B inhibitor zeta [Archocentrus centrarchus]|uniref:NF-kappa-B inhibitor zeta n=1 Tax=Archocentrus centrarchus TaxID=63155 RepID=UPI0011EA28E5|nr:NF-kappa-B inhibitor zeta-like [Archocentrus centrarchus]